MLKRVLLVIWAVWIGIPCTAQDRHAQLLAKATQIFGRSLTEHDVFRLNEQYVLWLITGTDGRLIEVTVGPKSYYSNEFPHRQKNSGTESLSGSEFHDALLRISKLRDLGQLKQSYYDEIPGIFGSLQTDEYEQAFVEKMLPLADASIPTGGAWKFSVHYIETVSGSPKQIVLTKDEPPQICLGSVWYYLPADEARKLQLGKWADFRATSTESNISRRCFRTVTLYDEDGFTIEEPQNETIVLSGSLRVRALRGSVHLSDQPVDGVNVEVLERGTKTILRAKTDANGRFEFPAWHKGSYKFKVSKDGFKALTGTIVVDPSASKNSLLFDLPVGT